MKRLFATIGLLFLGVVVYAQSSIIIKAPNIVGLDEQFNLSFIISGDAPSEFSWEPGSDFDVLWGPQKGTSSSTTRINGQTTKSHQTTYTYVLMPKKKGSFQINVATATVKGKKITSPQTQIEVVADDSKKAQSSDAGSSARQGASVSSEDLLLKIQFSKRDVLVGEPITATLKFYQRVNVAGFENVRFPEFNGFWSQEDYAPSNLEFARETVGGKIYEAAVVRVWTIIPQQSGVIVIDPAELVCLVNIRTSNPNTGSIFDSFFQDNYQTIRKRVSTESVSLRVNPLPAGAPASFGGGVGKYSISAKLSRDTLKTHDAASLIVSVRGSGNTSLIEAPKVNFPPDFEAYDVRTSDIEGGKQFEYPFIPRSHGDFVIEPVEYSYLDISTRKYVSLRSNALDLVVEKGAESASTSSGQIIASPTQKDVRSLNEDIRFIKTAMPRWTSVDAISRADKLFWMVVAALFALAVIGFFASRSIAQRRADVVGTKNRAALKQARKRLSAASGFLHKEQYSAFYEELHRALLGYVSDKFNLDASELAKDNIAEHFVASGVSEAVAAEFVELLDACEFARYAPSSASQAMSSHYEKGLALISTIEQGMRRKGSGFATTAIVALALMLPMASAWGAGGDDVATLWAAAVEEYTDGDWAAAVENWHKIESEGFASWELYYNLGNAYFREDDIAHAVLYFERALRLKPANADVRFNLELARAKTMDKIEVVPEFFLVSWVKGVRAAVDGGIWEALALVLLALGLFMSLLFLRGVSVNVRRSGFIVGLLAFVLSVSCGAMYFSQRAELSRTDQAVVVRPVTSVKSSPSEGGAKDLFVLHEGTKLTILESLGSWSNVELSDGRQGWLRSGEIEVI